MDGDGASAASLPVFTPPRGKYGLLKTNIMTGYATIGVVLGGPSSPDGVLFLTSAESIADAWIAWAKTNPRYMRLVQVLWGGAFLTLALAHAPLVAGLLANHGVHVPNLLNPLQASISRSIPGLGSAATAASTAPLPGTDGSTPPLDPFTANYRPVGAFAPTEDMGPPPTYTDDGILRVYPDEGIPADVETALRQLAMQTGKPYAELVTAYQQEVAQERIAQTTRVNTPGTLGMPVTQPGA